MHIDDEKYYKLIVDTILRSLEKEAKVHKGMLIAVVTIIEALKGYQRHGLSLSSESNRFDTYQSDDIAILRDQVSPIDLDIICGKKLLKFTKLQTPAVRIKLLKRAAKFLIPPPTTTTTTTLTIPTTILTIPTTDDSATEHEKKLTICQGLIEGVFSAKNVGVKLHHLEIFRYSGNPSNPLLAQRILLLNIHSNYRNGPQDSG